MKSQAWTILPLLWLLVLLSSWCQLSCAATDSGYIVFEHSILEQLLQDYVPAPSTSTKKIACSLARGQYKSVCVGIHAAKTDLDVVRLQIESDLGSRVYRPIDAETAAMLAALKDPMPEWIHLACLDENDAIASIPKGTTSYFWITLHADEAAVPGTYSGRILVRPAGSPASELTLDLVVHPFVLRRARIVYAPFMDEPQYLPDFVRGNDEWIARIFRDMGEHSHNSMIGLGHRDAAAFVDVSVITPPANRTFEVLLPLARQSGLTPFDIPIIHYAHRMTVPEHEGGPTVVQKNRFMAWYDSARKARGWPELVAYGMDEPQHPNPILRKRYDSFREVRMRLATAMNARAAYGLGDLHDIWIVFGGQITSEMCAEAERLGAEVWTYSYNLYPHTPLNERYFAGLYVWAYGLKGHTTWHHYAQDGYKHVWFREGDKRPMPLTGWETRREGIDDYRYLQMLEDCVAANPDESLAAEAGGWLEALRGRITTDPHEVEPGRPLALEEYDLIRVKAADYIERLGPVPPEQIPPQPVSHLKDEAKSFRGKSVQECMAGLASDDVSVRRAAAWALFEMGPQAARATNALVYLLDDPRVRMPALRALEAIGPPIYPAAAKLAVLLRHPDGYVRVGATFALGAMGSTPPDVKWLTDHRSPILGPSPVPESRAAVEPLRLALKDEFGPVVLVAGQQLARFGEFAKAALPEAIELLEHPKWEYWVAGLKIIAVMGAEAKAAVPKIVERYETKQGQDPYEAVTLAALGPSATEAIPALERYATPSSSYLADAYYALFCIRGQTADLEKMVKLLTRTDLTRNRQKHYVVGYLNALGVTAAPVADEIRAMLKSKDIKNREGLEAFLEKVDAGEGPYVLLP